MSRAQTDPRLQRKHLRAPLKSTCLYVDEDHVFKARVVNVSEGGILLSDLPHIPEINSLPIAINLIHHPKLNVMTIEQLRAINVDDLPRTILKTKARMVRSFEGQSNVDKVFVNFIGCEFYNPAPDFRAVIKEYVEVFAKNTVYLLSLFESLGNRSEQLEMLRLVSQLLGYDSSMKIPLLRAKVLHDYQSLEGL